MKSKILVLCLLASPALHAADPMFDPVIDDASREWCYAPASKRAEVNGSPLAKKLDKGPALADAETMSAVAWKDVDWPAYRHDPARGGATPAVVSSKLKTNWSVKVGRKLSPLSVVGDRVHVAAIDEHTVHCLDGNSGATIWSYVAGGRIDTPPTIYGDFAVFGAKDGWTYCLRASDGRLVWRFHGGPRNRMVGVFDQLESAWPVHGAVIVQRSPQVNGGEPVVYLASGRNTFLDSGIFLYALDLKSGNIVAHHILSGPYDSDGNPIVEKTWVLEGVKNDILVSDGEHWYIKDIALNPDCSPANTKGRRHLIATGRSLLDAYWHHRSLWVIDTQTPYFPNGKLSGNLMAFHGSEVYSFRSHTGGRNSTFSPDQGYELRRLEILPKDPDTVAGRRAKAKRRGGRKQKGGDAGPARDIWACRIDLICKAIALTGIENKDPSKEILFLAGAKNPGDPTQVEAALQGKKGGLLYAMATKDGRKLVEYILPTLPVYDGMAAAPGKLFLALRNGSVLCMENEKCKTRGIPRSVFTAFSLPHWHAS